MKLKYYLRGVGIGIIFATLVMTVSSFVHKNNITDEYIIKEAQKLGMVMKDELKNSEDIWGKDETEDSQTTEDTQTTEDSQTTEDTQGTEETSETQDTQVSESETVLPSESESQTPPSSESESQTPPASEEKQYVYVTVVRGDYARQIAEKVRDAGLIEDAEDFRKYIGRQGYGQLFHAGTYKIPMGASYEEICQILISR